LNDKSSGKSSKILGIATNIKHGEKIRIKLKEMRLLEGNYKIEPLKDKILIPVIRNLSSEEKLLLQQIDPNFEIVQYKFKRQIRRVTDYREYLKDRINEKLLKFLPRSFDIIGNIVIIEIPEILIQFENLIGESIIKCLKNIRTVYAKSSGVSGDFRLRNLRLIGGIDDPITIHKENNCIFELNVKKVYFSPRLGSERLRVVNSVKNGETIIDMFAGVGPYSIQIAKNKVVKVIAFDINPDAIFYLKRNIKLNKTTLIKPILGNIRDKINDFQFSADRVIMNLPGSAFEFLDCSCKLISKKGGVIHYYQFIPSEVKNKEVLNTLENRIKKFGRKIENILFCKKIKQISPTKSKIAIDIEIK